MSHLHCKSCRHCVSLHVVAPIRRNPFTPIKPDAPLVVQCAKCDYGDDGKICPAGGTSAERQDILRRIFVQDMRDTIEETGL